MHIINLSSLKLQDEKLEITQNTRKNKENTSSIFVNFFLLTRENFFLVKHIAKKKLAQHGHYFRSDIAIGQFVTLGQSRVPEAASCITCSW